MEHPEAPRSAAYRTAEQAIGDLPKQLSAWRAQLLTFEEMAFRLREQVGVIVTGETVRTWCNRLRIDERRAS